MSTGFGRRQIQSLVNLVFGKTPADTPAGVIFVGLSVGDSGDDGQSGAEATGTGYARVETAVGDWDQATLATPSVTDNVNAITFPEAGGDWSAQANMTHFTLWSSLSGATEADYIGRGLLSSAQPVLSGQTPNFPAGSLRMTGIETA